jgi:O-antigen/teichoic acid export membrane protein
MSLRLDRTAVLHFGAQVVRSLAGFGTTLLAARYFGATGLGIYSQILALHFWLKLPSGSVQSAISKRMSETKELTGHFTAGLVGILVYGVVIGIVILVFERTINNYIGIEAAQFLVSLLLVNMMFDLVKQGFVGRKQVAISGWLGTGEQILRFTSQLAFVIFGITVVGLVYGHVISLFLFAAFGVFLLRKHLKKPTRKDFHDLKTFAQYSWLGSIQTLALTWMDIIILGIFVADNFVGIYQAAWTLASFLALVSKSIQKTLFPELSDLGATERYGRARQLVNEGLVFAGIFLFPGLFGAFLIGDRILALYNTEFSAGATILVLLILARIFYAFAGQLTNAINGLDRPDIAFQINAIVFSINILGNIILVYQFGWYGAAVATLFSTGAYLLFSWYKLQEVIRGIQIPVVEIGYQLAASVVMVSVLLLLPNTPQNTIFTIGIIAVGASIYSTVLIILSTRIRKSAVRMLGM